MRILFDIVHPAHVHFFKNMISALRARGHATHVLARDKEVTCRLLDGLGLPYDVAGRPSRWGRIGQLKELVERNVVLVRLIRRFGADVVVTRNPAGVQAARLAGAVGIFDTDDGAAAGVHFHAARPFAHFLTSPDCLPGRWGARHFRYPGFKQSAYLHPDHFTPDPTVRDELGIADGERVFIVRFVSMEASHDHGESGMSLETRRSVIERLLPHGRVFLSTEGPTPPEWEHLRFALPPTRLHDAMAFADLVVGDSQTMSAEAAFLGTPSLRVSTFAGRLDCLEELEHEYGMTWGFHPREVERLMARLDALLDRDEMLEASIRDGHRRLLEEKVNVADWFVEFIERHGADA
jgi:predicted glycosyltransferase